ncbi:multidrug effflux MFS transporter [Stagnihabitans tardus]|uniref:Bcr/CflA family efflux transporter n=1 Tax=Stagnihabitans tardus TaxID=2699202 RepID=A0AAE4YB88_9RHOB|nr:multidrug effflux MFS transporter [Stagnihabitans tardus]NBZ88058.1 Bcr/CflA family efflux MFS transporter [Stagnihabitans tardus]
MFLNRKTPPKIVTLTLLAGLSSFTLSLMLPALPAMASWFGTSVSTMQLAVSLYLALSAVVQLIIGPISDRFGRRPVILGALVVFLLATIGTIYAPDAGTFLAFRMAQAVVSTGLVLSRAVVRDMVEGPAAASMIGYVTMGMSLVPMIGPLIGGALEERFGWQSTFWLLFGLGVATTALAFADLGETFTRREGGTFAQMRLYPRLLKSRIFWAHCGVASLASGVFYAFLGGAPYVGAEVYHLSSSQIGAAFALPSVGYMAGNYLAGRHSVRVGMVRMIVMGTSVTTCAMTGLALITALGLSGPWVFFGAMVFLGLGNGMSLPNANGGMLQAVPELAGSASGLGGAISIGSGAGVSALAIWLLPPGAGDLPLIVLMAVSSALSTLSLLILPRRSLALQA